MFGTVMFLNTWYSMKKNTPLENFTWLLVQLMGMQFRSNKRKKKIFVVVHSLAFGGRGCFFSNRRLKKECRIFNATLGYPGEGPKKKTKMTGVATWGDLLGPMCIFLDDQWCDGCLIEVRENHVLYSLSEDPSEQFILQKDEAYKLIRSRKVVKSNGKGEKYNGSNPLIFGPDGACIYGKKIRERKDRAGFYRLEIKFKPTQAAKVKTIKINLGKHVRLCLLCFFVYLLLFSTLLLVCPCILLIYLCIVCCLVCRIRLKVLTRFAMLKYDNGCTIGKNMQIQNAKGQGKIRKKKYSMLQLLKAIHQNDIHEARGIPNALIWKKKGKFFHR